MSSIIMRFQWNINSIQKNLAYLLTIVIALTAFASNAMCAQVTLSWDANSESDLAGYVMHYGTSSSNYSSQMDVGNTTTCTVPDLTAGTTYYFAVTAYTTSQAESGYSNEVPYTIPAEPTTPTLSSISISGPTSVNENSSAQYACTAHYSDGSSTALASGITWNENSTAAAINSSGNLTTASVTADTPVTITAVYGGRSDTHSITIKKTIATLTSLSISGPTQVDEESSATFTCSALYSDTKTSNVSDSVVWSVTSASAVINSDGRLTTRAVPNDEHVTITASLDGKRTEYAVLIKDSITTYTLTIDVSGSGTVTLAPPGGTYNSGTVVTLTATPHTAWVFDGWGGNVSDTESSITTLIMDADITVSATFLEDTDQDSVPDREEWGKDSLDSTFDGNQDSIADYLQSNVVSLHTTDYQNFLTLSSPESTKIKTCKTTDTANLPDSPAQCSLPLGLIDFQLENIAPGAATTLTIHLPPGFEFNTYYKFGATPDNPTAHWYKFMYDQASQTGAVFERDTVTLHYIDGQRGDDDLSANGIISDPGGPGILQADTDQDISNPGTDPNTDPDHFINDGNTANTSSGSGGGCFIHSLLGQ